MSDTLSSTGSILITPDQLYALAPIAQPYLQQINNNAGNDGIDEWFMAGDTTVVGAPRFEMPYAPGIDVQVIGPVAQTGNPGFGPDSNIVLAAGYSALIAEGNEPINLIDQGSGNALLVGNSGNGTIAAFGANDTLVGATGANTVFYTALNPGTAIPAGPSAFIEGGGDDTITTYENASITTSAGRSRVFLAGATENQVASHGNDEIICSRSGLSQDTVTATQDAGLGGDTVFGPTQGELTFDGGASPAIVVGSGGQVVMYGGGGKGSVLWAGDSPAEFLGGAGSATVVGGSQELFVQAGSGALTVWGGTGNSIITGAAGPSTFVVGLGDATVSAASGNTVWVIGSAQVSVAASAGVDAFGGLALGNNIFQAGAGSETLWGGAGNDSFIAGSGSATFVSGGGHDVFSFTNGLTGGSDEIVGFMPGADTVALHGYGAVVPTVTVKNGSSIVTLGDGTHLLFYGVTNLTASSFTMS